jgi:hypothetical protein
MWLFNNLEIIKKLNIHTVSLVSKMACMVSFPGLLSNIPKVIFGSWVLERKRGEGKV